MAALLPIVHDAQPVLLVLSALGKTTNALEVIVNEACNSNRQQAHALARQLQQQHLDHARALLDEHHYEIAFAALQPFFTEMKNAVDSADPKRYDYSYDQAVCVGELMSSRIFACYLQQHGIENEWVDIRKVIHTDSTYRDANISWEESKVYAEAIIGAQLKNGRTIVTQGFIGSDPANNSVTLGREGSDYTAAVLAAMLQLSSVTIWKDVEGFRNADPKLFPNTVKIDALSYNEVIEMAYYGAQIIHPKTIKPLQNNDIPLYVKCFLDRNLAGSVIKTDVDTSTYPPLIVLKDNQLLIQVTTRDFSFITEDNLSRIYSIFHALKVKINIIQNAAISFVACIDNREDKVNALLNTLEKDYKVTINDNVSLLTIRHYSPEVVTNLTAGRQILLKQETRKTIQMVMK